MKKWYIENGENGDIVLSTRVRFARNIEEFPFPSKLSDKDMETINLKIRDILLKESAWNFNYIKMSDFSRSQIISLAERHIISPEFAGNSQGKALIMTDDEAISIMLCEEDHIRLQVMMSGLALKEAYNVADKVDNILNNSLNYAFDERIGYLTQCPTNIGTGMRASVMLHLPALTRCGQMGKLSSTVSKLGLVIRGAYGEGSTPVGDIYQLSNQITLGISEQAAIDNLQSITLQLIAQEKAAAKELVENAEVCDKIWRAAGILQNARLLTTKEFMELASLLRMGISAGIINMDLSILNELTVSVQPATVNAHKGRDMTAKERDALRAEAVRKSIIIK